MKLSLSEKRNITNEIEDVARNLEDVIMRLRGLRR